MSDQVIISLIGGVIGLISIIFGGVLTYLTAKLNKKTEKAALVTEVKLDAIAKVADATHKLTNSNMGIQLRLTAGMARRVADLTGKPKDIQAADEADLLSKEHQTQQDKVDEKYPGGVPDSQDPPKPKYTDLEPK